MFSHTFFPNLPIFLHRYICHICDILQLKEGKGRLSSCECHLSWLCSKRFWDLCLGRPHSRQMRRRLLGCYLFRKYVWYWTTNKDERVNSAFPWPCMISIFYHAWPQRSPPPIFWWYRDKKGERNVDIWEIQSDFINANFFQCSTINGNHRLFRLICGIW